MEILPSTTSKSERKLTEKQQSFLEQLVEAQGDAKKAAELADRALDEAWKHTKAGASEAKILAKMQGAVLEGGGDYPANEYIIGSGHNALLCRYQSEKRILSNEDQLSIEWAGTYKHYHSAMFRTIPIGKACLLYTSPSPRDRQNLVCRLLLEKKKNNHTNCHSPKNQTIHKTIYVTTKIRS